MFSSRWQHRRATKTTCQRLLHGCICSNLAPNSSEKSAENSPFYLTPAQGRVRAGTHEKALECGGILAHQPLAAWLCLPVPRVYPSRFLVVVIDEIHFAVVIPGKIPSFRQRYLAIPFPWHISLEKSIRCRSVSTTRPHSSAILKAHYHYHCRVPSRAEPRRAGSGGAGGTGRGGHGARGSGARGAGTGGPPSGWGRRTGSRRGAGG